MFNYADFLKQRKGAKVEFGWKCLCCRDAAIVPAYLIQKYNLLKANPLLGEISFLPSAEGQLCQNPTCEANSITINHDGKWIHTVLYADGTLDRSIPPQVCRWVHEQELIEIRQPQKPADILPIKLSVVMPSIGGVLTNAKEPEPLEIQVDRMRQYLLSGDRILQREAIDWVKRHASVDFVFGEDGEFVDLVISDREEVRS